MSNNPQFLEKPLPSSPDAERVILGAILLDNELCAQAAESLTPDDFYSPSNRRIFKAMLALFEQGNRIDPILIGEEIKRDGGSVESSGGVAAITNLTYGLPRFSDIADYVKTVEDKRTARDIIRAATEISSFALGEEESIETVVNFAESKIFDVCNRPQDSKPEPISSLVFQSIEKTFSIIEKGEKITGLTTGLFDVDAMTGGWKRTDLIIVAGRPSMGKTLICLAMAQNGAFVPGNVVAVFSLEMSKEQLTARQICSEARIDLARYLNGKASREDMERAVAAAETLSKTKMIIDDTPGLAPVQMLAKARRIFAEHKRLDLIVVDYLQLMSSSGRRGENRQQEVSSISRELKAIAKQLNVPVIALSQLSRAPEARNPPRPMMSDLRESGSIEQDADVVAFIYREDYYKPSEENAGVAELIFTKQRNGPTGTVKLSFLKEFTRFENFYDESDWRRISN